jgi:rsbT co-antagonist protein RsbR
VVIAPLIGTIDSQRAQQFMDAMLGGVTEHRAATVILDVTGVEVVDTHVAGALVRASRAVRLLGAEVVLTGIRPEVARTLAHMGEDLGSLVIHGSLRSGVIYAINRGNTAQNRQKREESNGLGGRR